MIRRSAVWEAPAATSHVDRGARRADVAGLMLGSVALAWTYASASIAEGAPGPVAVLILACGVAFAAGRLAASTWSTTTVAVVVGLCVVIGWRSLGGVVERPRVDPLGYSNATAAFFVLATCAALLLATTWRAPIGRMVAAVLAVAFAALTLRTRSAAGSILLLLPLAALAARTVRTAKLAAVVAASLVALALAVTTALGIAHPLSPGPVRDLVGSTLSERRPALWADALDLMAAHPLAGVGPGRFAAESRIAAIDEDARWAHNEFLQQGAEQGVIGGALLLGAFLWGAIRLLVGLRAGATARVASLGAAALAALGIHASVDYVLHFPAVPIVAAGLLGIATVSQIASDERGVDVAGT